MHKIMVVSLWSCVEVHIKFLAISKRQGLVQAVGSPDPAQSGSSLHWVRLFLIYPRGSASIITIMIVLF